MTRQPNRGPLKNYRSVDTSGGVWWKRVTDPVGAHSVLAFIVGVALVAVVGVTLDPLGVTTEFDLDQVKQEAAAESFAAARVEGLAMGAERSRRQTLFELALRDTDGGSAWIQGVRAGWIEGWNQALTALTEASGTNAPADELARELGLLEAIPRR